MKAMKAKEKDESNENRKKQRFLQTAREKAFEFAKNAVFYKHKLSKESVPHETKKGPRSRGSVWNDIIMMVYMILTNYY